MAPKKSPPKAVKTPALPLRFTVSGLARAWGYSVPQISAWKADGLTFEEDGKVGLAEATRWLRQHERREKMRSDGTDAGKRRSEAEASLMELKLAKELGEVVLASEVYAANEDEALRVRGIVALLPSSYAPTIATRLSCNLRDASAVLREIAEDLSAQIASDDEEEEAA